MKKLPVFRTLRSGAIPLAAALVALASSAAFAGTYLTGPLPSEFGGGFIPPNPAVLKNVQKATKESAKLAASVEKCFAKGAANFSKGKATGVGTCLNDPAKGVLPKFQAKIAGIAGKAPGLPPCHDFAADGNLIAGLVKGFNSLTYCDGGTTACTSAIVTVSTSYTATDASGVTTFVDYPDDLLDIPGSGNEPSVLERVVNLTGVSGSLFSVGDQDTDANTFDDRIAVGVINLGTPIPAGNFAQITYDCKTGEPAPDVADFACTLDASDTNGNAISGTCSVALTLVP